MSHFDTIIDDVELTSSVTISLSQFIPLIRDVSDVFKKILELYDLAQHNKNITKILMERISAANSSVSILQVRRDLLNSTYYKNLQRLVQVLQDMKIYIREITHYNTVQKFLGVKKIENEFKELCKEYDSSMTSLNFNLLVNFNTEDEDKIVKEDVEQLIKFQEALVESMNDVNQNVSHTNDQMDLVVERVSEMVITMQSMMHIEDDQIQNRIDNVFRISSLPFEDYEEADEISKRSDKLRKYVHIITKEEFAFKVVNQSYINDIKNQVAILSKLKECQNIINFYGLTSNGCYTTYLVTEWAEKGSLREYILEHEQNINLKLKMRIAYDIAKGLNFLNSVGMVHQDIRSENIVITNEDIAKITNFKLKGPKVISDTYLAINRDNIRHIAPEILRIVIGSEEKDKYSIKYDITCEVYSFGILLWEIAECKISYNQFEDSLEIIRKVLGGYREKFTLGTDIPEKYQELANKAVDTNSGSRPLFSRMLTILHDIFKSYESPTSHSNSLKSNRPSPITSYVQKKSQSTIIQAKEDSAINWNPLNSLNSSNKPLKIISPVQKMIQCTIAAAAEDYAISWGLPAYHSNSMNSNGPSPITPLIQKMTQDRIAAADYAIDWDSFDYMTLDKAIECHKNESKDKQKIYKCFDTYAEMDNPRAKYWKAYYITKGWSNLNCPDNEKHKVSVQLFKEAADYGDEFPDAQLRYATMVMHGKGVKHDKDEAIKYFLKAAKNGHLVAMFNIATLYYSKKENELGNYYMISAANKGYEQAINYCKKKNISY